MNKYIPGRINEIEEYQPLSGSFKIRLDANESPFAPSPELKAQLAQAAAGVNVNRYPDAAATELTAAYAAYIGVAPEQIVAGNGSDELISLIASAFAGGRKMLTVLPDFSMYGFYGEMAGGDVVRLGKGDGFAIDLDAVSAAAGERGAQLVIFSNPCNPTGQMCDSGRLLRFIDKTDAIVAVDEAYMEFARRDGSVAGYAAERENLVVLRTMSKAFGLAGLRLGFAVTNRELAAALRKVKSPYNISAVSQAMGVAALAATDEMKRNVRALSAQRELLYRRLEALSGKCGFRLYPGEANFAFVEFTDKSRAAAAWDFLCGEGIVVRRFTGGFLRITVGTPEENDALTAALEKFGSNL